MGDDKTAIQGNFQTYLTDQKEGKEDLNTDYPGPDAVRFLQFHRIMEVGFGMASSGVIANQTDKIMVSYKRQGRTEAKESLIGMDQKEFKRSMYGPQWQDVDDSKKKK